MYTTTIMDSAAKAEYLEHSILFDSYLVTEYPNVNRLAHSVYDVCSELSAIGSYPKSRIIQAITNIALNMYIGYTHDFRIAISLALSSYKSPERYGRLQFRYRLLVPVLRVLIANGFIIEYPGYHSEIEGRLTRLDASEKLIALFEKFAVNEMPPEELIDLDRGDCIVLHKKVNGKATLEDYEDSEFTKQARIQLQKYNRWLDTQGISIPLVKEKPSLSGKLLQRIFNDDFSHGGRFYAGYQGLTFSEETRTENSHYPGPYYRKDITFAGEKSVELDFSGLHPNMCYHMEHSNMSGKAYAIGDYPKYLVKKFILVCFNAESDKQGKKAFVEEAFSDQKAKKWEESTWVTKSELHKRFAPISEAFLKHHSQIAKYVYSGIGLELQFHDSNIMGMILEDCMRARIPALPVHDSIIVPESKKEQAKAIMLACYQEYMVETFNLDFTPSIVVEEK